MQSNKIHKVFLMSEFYSALMLARRVSDLTGPSSGASFTSCARRLVCGNTRNYSTRPAVTKLFFLQLCNGWTCRVVRVLPHTKVCECSLYKTLLMMDR